MPTDRASRYVAVVGTCDTKFEDVQYVRDLILSAGVAAKIVDLSPRGSDKLVDVTAAQVKAGTVVDVGSMDRGQAIADMAGAFKRWVLANVSDISGMIGVGGSGNTALITPGMGSLPIGVPKLMVSTVASGNVAPYVGPNDIAMMYSVVDVAGLNAISRTVLSNAANMIAGAAAHPVAAQPDQDKPAIGLSMFGVTTPCVERIVAELRDDYECFVFHATGTGGQTMEKLADSGRLVGMIDCTTTEVADLLMGGVMSAGEDRMGAAIRTGLPYVGSCGALDMVNFGAAETVPEQYRNRQLLVHNAQVTLMRTTPEENSQIGTWIGGKLNQMQGQVRFLIPEKGVSIIDVEGAPFHDAEADKALFDALERTVQQTEKRRLVRMPLAINDPAFADALVQHFTEIMELSK